MIYEIRTYTLKAGATAEFEKRWGAAYPVREKYSPIAGFFHTDFGPLNEVIHIWPYENLDERTRIRADAAKEENWPPNTSEFIINQKVEILIPFPFAPEWQPGKLGPIYELRQYVFQAGGLPDIIAGWKDHLPDRLKLSAPCLLGAIEFGPSANSFIHMWPYSSFEERSRVRAEAAASGRWPPVRGREHYLMQSNKLLLPASFSPAQ